MQITALAGGVGAAKLISGLVEVLPAEQVTVVVNTGDDFDWMGLRVCPDIDTITYTLAGDANPETGWGLKEDTFRLLERLAHLGGPAWFRIGDGDAALHLQRTEMLRSGKSLAEVTRSICCRLGVRCRVLPMTDSFVPTKLHTSEGLLAFQDYFVRRRCQPRVDRILFTNIESSRPAAGVIESIAAADAIIVCPSNPFISIGPILAVPGIREELRRDRERVLAVSPVICGRAIKGPTAEMLAQMGHEVSAGAVARLYCDFAGVFVLDAQDQALERDISALGWKVLPTPTLMNSPEARVQLARRILEAMQ